MRAKELAYSEDQAYRRINAMRIVKELPQIEEKISAGALTLSALSVAGSVFKANAKSGSPMACERKIEFLEAVCHKSGRECEVIAQSYSTVPRGAIRLETIKPKGE